MYTQEEIILLQTKGGHEIGAVAAMAWMVWDTIINLSDEVEYLWSGHASWVKWTYVFIRYAPIIHGGVVINHYGTTGNSRSKCKAYIAYELSFLEVLTIAVEIILMIRVFVLYKQNRILRAIILAAFIAEVASMLVLISFVIKGQRFTDDCIGDSSPEVFVGYWISVQVFETFLFVLTFAKCFRGCFRKGADISRRKSVFYLLLRDGTWAFGLILVSTLLNLLLYQLNDTPRADDGYFWELAVLSFSGSHIILNIRRLRGPGALSRTDVSYLWDHGLDFGQETCFGREVHTSNDVEIVHIEMSDLP